MGEKPKLFDLIKVNEPIFIEDIIKMYPTRSRQWIDNELSELTASGQLVRYATGIYYRPRKNRESIYRSSKVTRNNIIKNGYSSRKYS